MRIVRAFRSSAAIVSGDTAIAGAERLIDLREYQLHDDVRHIDWNVTARLQVPHVRVYTEDRDLTAWFLLDLSASIGFGSSDRSKQTVCWLIDAFPSVPIRTKRRAK